MNDIEYNFNEPYKPDSGKPVPEDFYYVNGNRPPKKGPRHTKPKRRKK